MSKAYQEAVLRGKQRTFGQFIWDSEENAFLGRTFTSWLKIIIFYNIYYGFLAVFFAVCMCVFYTTLDINMPKYTPGRSDSILRHPSLGFRPMPRIWDIDSDVIWYNADRPEYMWHWVEELEIFMQSYESESLDRYTQDIRECSDESPGFAEYGEVCQFNSNWLGTSCNKENGFGYESRSPCVILKMNKMIGWVPDVYEAIEELPHSMPADLRDHIMQSAADNGGMIKPMVWVSCTQTMASGEILDDIGKINYSPWRGFPAYFFPYLNTPGYMPPIVAIEFTAPPTNNRIDVECKLWAKNIMHNRKDSLGLVHFSLVINTDI